MSTLFSDYLSLSAVVVFVGMYVMNVYCAMHEGQEEAGQMVHHVESHSYGH